MRTDLIYSIILFLVAQVASAQGITSAEQIATYENKLVKEKLDLTEEQMESVFEVNETFAEKQFALMNEEGSRLGKMGAFKDLKDAKAAELKKHLNKEQLKAYQKEVAPEVRSYMRENARN